MNDTWRRLELTDDQLEVLVHMSIKRGASPQELISDVWPTLTPDEGRARLDQTVTEINTAASAATGKPGPVITSAKQDSSHGGAAFGLPSPEMHVRVLGTPYVEVR
ncbi:hypothetical protein AB6N24_09855 [Cellulomonas sp. 179-A 4D5 NHS]|uniref:hypothetical protein n=1 Tax=Cellulomonas sp. 179-A 4D5 NHS TaxID=3142378 RepID=UPI00399F7A37